METAILMLLLAGATAAGGWLGVRFERARRYGEHAAQVAELRAKADVAEGTASAREELLALVKQGAGEELAQRGEQLVALATANFNTALTKAGAADEQRRQAVVNLVEPVQQSLTQLKSRLDQVDDARQRTERELTAQLRSVTTGQQEVSRNAAALERALRQPHVRGRWGELALRRLAEAAGMNDLCDFSEQTHVNDDGRVLRPDMLVRLPGDRLVVVDAKVNLSPFLDAMEATTDLERAEKLKLYARGMRAHVRKLAEKSYASQFPQAPQFVVMYVPGDHFLSGALEVDGELLEYAFAQRVHIATPATLLALLRTVAYAFQNQKVAEDAQAVAQLGRELYERICALLGHIDKVSARINSLVTAQSAVVGSVERRVLPSARRFAEFGIVGTDELPTDVRRVTADARRVQADELPAAVEVHELPSPTPTEEAA